MSNAASAGHLLAVNIGNVEIAVYAGWTALALILARRCGVFRLSSIRGPGRLSEGESVVPLLMTLMLGLSAWFIVGGSYAQARQRPVAPTSGPTTAASTKMELSAADKIRMSALVGAAGTAALLVGSWRLRPGGLKRLGLSAGRVASGLRDGTIGMVITLPLLLWANVAIEFVWKLIRYRHPTEHELLRAVAQVPGGLVVLMVVSVTAIAPLFEELFFRGHLQTALRAAMGPWPAIILTAVCFSLLHDAWTSPVIFLLAICLGYVYERTGNLWASIAMHAIFNGYQTALFLAGHS